MKRSSLFLILAFAVLLAFAGGSVATAAGKCCSKDAKAACMNKACAGKDCKDKAQCTAACAKNGCKDKGQCTEACKAACKGSCDKAACAAKCSGSCKPGDCKKPAPEPAPSK